MTLTPGVSLPGVGPPGAGVSAQALAPPICIQCTFAETPLCGQTHCVNARVHTINTSKRHQDLNSMKETRDADAMSKFFSPIAALSFNTASGTRQAVHSAVPQDHFIDGATSDSAHELLIRAAPQTQRPSSGLH